MLYRIFLSLLLIASNPGMAQLPLTGRDTTINGTQSFAMVVGISHYRYIRPLSYADKDAELFRDWLKSPAGGRLKQENIFCLLNEDANNANFWGKGFQWLKAKDLRRGDKLFIYLAGHGDAIDEDQYFFLGVDCKPDGDKNNYLVSGAIQLFNLKKKIANETAKGVEVVFIMDACRSNELPGGTPGQNFLNTAVSQKKAGEIMMLATAAGQVSLEDVSIGNGHGLFTWTLIDGLTGNADTKADRKITFSEIQAYVDDHVATQAMQQFKRRQQPFFCCNENSDKVISIVDTVYFNQWQKIKKQLERRKGGNSFAGELVTIDRADTALIETYNRFNRAIRTNRLTGNESAEEYFQQLNTKYPGNPYTLDAKSSLAVQFLNVAQSRVNRYLDCAPDQSAAEKQSNYLAAVNLEKAIAIFKDIDDDFATSLRGRLLLLKASGDFGASGVNGNTQEAFNYAYQALIIEPKGAFVYNKLAQLHLQNRNKDSSLFYARRAVELAPNWNCALTTLALAQQGISISDEPKKKVKNTAKAKPGVMFGAGFNASNPKRDNNVQTSIISAATKSAFMQQLGIFYLIPVSTSITFRPVLNLQLGSIDVQFQRTGSTGGPVINETITLKTPLLNFSPGFIYNLKSTASYILVSPSISYKLNEDEPELPLKKYSMSADVGAGLNLSLKRPGLILTPEIKLAIGITDIKEQSSSIYASALSSLKNSAFSLSIYLRKK